jgi:hypothetical protein
MVQIHSRSTASGPIQMNTPEPKFVSLPHWCIISGMSRTASYYALGRGDLKAIKIGSRTLIDVDAGITWLRSLPAPAIRAPKAA